MINKRKYIKLAALVSGALLLVILCVINGYRLEGDRIRSNTLRSRNFVYLYQKLNLSRLVTYKDGRAAAFNDTGRWVLLVFSRTWCHYCDNELQALEKLPANVTSKVRVINVIQDENVDPGVHTPSFEVAFDPKSSLASLCGSKGTTPYSVLLDPQYRVRYTFDGFGAVAPSSSELSEDVKAFVTGGSTNPDQFLWDWRRRPVLPNVEVTTARGEHTSLRALSDNKILVVVSANDDALSREKLASLRCFYAVPQFNFVCANLSDLGASVSPEAFREVKWTSAQRLSRVTGTSNAPGCAVVYKSRIIASERGPLSPGSSGIFNRLLSQIALFSQPVLQKSSVGSPVRTGWRERIGANGVVTDTHRTKNLVPKEVRATKKALAARSL